MNKTQVQVLDCNQPAALKLERVNYFNRQLLTAEDMTTERDYFLQKLRRHNRYLHGWGVVCGIAITAAPTEDQPWRVLVGTGYALGPYGDEIFVGETVYFDLAQCLTGGATNPCEPNMTTGNGAGASTTVYLAIQYAECFARPVRVASAGCGCDDDPCQYSRVRDSFSLKCLPQLPTPPPPPPSLCGVVRGAIAPCPPCPADPWVVLAKITLPSASSMNITNSVIDNSVRRVLLSTAVLQEQLVRCCCGSTTSSSSSSSGTSLVVPPPGDGVPVLNIAQRANKIPGTDLGGVQFAVTVINSGSLTAEKVVVVVQISPALPATGYTVTPAAGWQGADLTELKSAPFNLAPGKARTLSFEIVPRERRHAVSVTANATAEAANTSGLAAASPLTIDIGG